MKTWIASIVLINSTWAFAQNSCQELFLSGRNLKKAVFLSMDRYGKERTMKNEFALLDKNTPVIQHDNLKRTEFFKVYGAQSTTVDTKNLTAAKKAFKQYEEDSRENTTQLVAKVLFEKDEKNNVNAWAVLIGQRTVDFKGQETISPKAIYSIERNSLGEQLKLITNQFGDLIM